MDVLVPLHTINIMLGTHRPQAPPTPPSKPPLRPNPFLLFLEPDIIFMLLSTALTYGLFVTIQSTTSLLFQQAYSSSEMEVGLYFLPMGVGCLLSSVVTGKQLDWEYKRCRRQWEEKRRARWEEDERHVGASEKQVDGGLESPSFPPPSKEEELTFHVEKARLRWSFVYTGLTIASCIGYGWALDQRVHMAVPLVIQFLFGWVVVGQMNSFQTLLIDVFPKQGSSTTAINNFVRCLLGAGIISVVNLIIDAIGAGWTYTLLSLIGAVAIPIFTLVVIRYGPRWRMRRWKKKNQN
ncbi:hypothetical protein FRC04_009432 [Tulasnella sp. 424]|nr:hypothetical protein FRC04_009432 [Tulasnella sp. 424]KAG8971884.1 hypothetical protein FRC05_010553 [Tulasnella sp. 425]